MKRLYFMRHGLSLHNQLGKFSGRLDSPLVDEGREDVKNSAQAIKKLKIDTIVSSPLSRAIESSQIIAGEIGYPADMILVNNLFSERDYGVLEGSPYIPLAVHDEIQDIETVEDLIKRAQLGLDWLNSLDGEKILLISHGAIGKALYFVISQESQPKNPVKFNNAEVVRLI